MGRRSERTPWIAVRRRPDEACHCYVIRRRHSCIYRLGMDKYLYGLFYLKGTYSAKKHIFFLALLYLFDSLNVLGQHFDGLQLRNIHGNVIRFKKKDYVKCPSSHFWHLDRPFVSWTCLLTRKGNETLILFFPSTNIFFYNLLAQIYDKNFLKSY